MTRQRAPRLSVEDRRTAIIDAVLPLLESHGEVSTRRIADAAGIAEGTIFRVFPDKRSLLLAAAERVVTPPGWKEQMQAALAEQPDLRGKVLVTTERMILNGRRVMLVMSALRRVLLTDGPGGGHQRHRHGPPTFLTESSRLLHEALTTLVFTPHRDELTMPPDRAARALQNLVMGGWHPGAPDGDRLSAHEITDVCLGGVAARGRLHMMERRAAERVP